MIKLGGEVRDKITGFKGIAIARTEWLYGCARIVVQPPVGKDGKCPANETFDELQLDVLKAAKIAVETPTSSERTGGPQDDKAALRRN